MTIEFFETNIENNVKINFNFDTGYSKDNGFEFEGDFAEATHTLTEIRVKTKNFRKERQKIMTLQFEVEKHQKYIKFIVSTLENIPQEERKTKDFLNWKQAAFKDLVEKDKKYRKRLATIDNLIKKKPILKEFFKNIDFSKESEKGFLVLKCLIEAKLIEKLKKKVKKKESKFYLLIKKLKLKKKESKFYLDILKFMSKRRYV